MLGKSLLANIKAFSLTKMNIKFYSTLVSSTKAKKDREFVNSRFMGEKLKLEPGTEFSSKCFQEHDRIVNDYANQLISQSELPVKIAELSSLVLQLSSVKAYLKGFLVIENFLTKHITSVDQENLIRILQNIIPLGFNGYSSDFYKYLAEELSQREDISDRNFAKIIGLLSFPIKQNGIKDIENMWERAGKVLKNGKLTFKDKFVLLTSIQENGVKWLKQEACDTFESMQKEDFTGFSQKDHYAATLLLEQFETAPEFEAKVVSSFMETLGKIKEEISGDMFAILLSERKLTSDEAINVMARLPFESQPMNIKISLVKALFRSMEDDFGLFQKIEVSSNFLLNWPTVKREQLEEYKSTKIIDRNGFFEKNATFFGLSFKFFSPIGHSFEEIVDMEEGYSDDSSLDNIKI